MQNHRAGAPSAPRETPLFPHHKSLHPLHREENERKPLEVTPGVPSYAHDAERFQRPEPVGEDPALKQTAGVLSSQRVHPSVPRAHKLSDGALAEHARKALDISPDASDYLPERERLTRVDAAAVEAAARAAAAAQRNATLERKRASGGAEPAPWTKEDAVLLQQAEAERRGPKPMNCSGAPVDPITGAYQSGAQGASLAQQDAAAAAAAALKRQEAAKRTAGAGYNLLTGQPDGTRPLPREGGKRTGYAGAQR